MLTPDSTPIHDGTTVRVSRVIRAQPGVVFDAWLKPELRRRWWACGRCDVCEIDARVGGVFRIGATDRGDGQAFIAVGEFREIDAPSRLVYTWTWEQPAGFASDTLVEVAFVSTGGGTEVCVTHSRFDSTEQAAPHRSGWEDGLSALAVFLE